MTSFAYSSNNALEYLALARQIADYAERQGINEIAIWNRVTCQHLGAILADSILQAGLNYRTVVKPRIERIIIFFPEAATMAGTVDLIERGAVANFLSWKHSEKIDRFIRLARTLESQNISDTESLHMWLQRAESRDQLLSLSGIGHKTVDYLCCLVGLDLVAIDRHARTFARNAGVEISDYEGLKTAFSYAADLLGLSRRDFDSWVWRLVSQKSASEMTG
jgi:hypothetical protein